MKILVSTLLMACVVPISMQAQTLHKVRTDMAETLPKVDNAKLKRVRHGIFNDKTPQRRTGQKPLPIVPKNFNTTHKSQAATPLYTTAAGTKLYGNVIYAKSWEDLLNSGAQSFPFGIYSFTANDNTTFTPIVESNDLYANGGAYYNDGTYHFVTRYTDPVTNEEKVVYYEYDANTWERTTKEAYDDATLVASDLTYDPVNDQVDGCFVNDNGDGWVLGYVDYSMQYRYAANEDLGDLRMVGMAANEDGEIYGIGSDGILYKIDGDTFDYEQVGETGVSVSTAPQSAAFDPKTGILYWAAQLRDGTAALYTVDTETGAATKVTDFNDAQEVTGLYILLPEASDEAPAAVTTLSASFTNGSTTGTVSFTAPTTTYDGSQLEGTITYAISINGEEKATGTTTPGAVVTANVENAPEGKATIEVTLSNDKGKSPKAQTSMWIGPDEPLEPKAITVTANEAQGTVALSWQAPTAGVHDGYVNASDITYTVTRQPDDTIVAKGIKATTFTDHLPANKPLTAYYYNVLKFPTWRTPL